jgi:hypothetical protein
MGCPPFDKIATMIDEALLKAQDEQANTEVVNNKLHGTCH